MSPDPHLGIWTSNFKNNTTYDKENVTKGFITLKSSKDIYEPHQIFKCHRTDMHFSHGSDPDPGFLKESDPDSFDD